MGLILRRQLNQNVDEPSELIQNHSESSTPSQSYGVPSKPSQSHDKPIEPSQSHDKPIEPSQSHDKPIEPSQSHDKASKTSNSNGKLNEKQINQDPVKVIRYEFPLTDFNDDLLISVDPADVDTDPTKLKKIRQLCKTLSWSDCLSPVDCQFDQYIDIRPLSIPYGETVNVADKVDLKGGVEQDLAASILNTLISCIANLSMIQLYIKYLCPRDVMLCNDEPVWIRLSEKPLAVDDCSEQDLPYISPEVLRKEREVVERIYSWNIGAIAYYLVTGRNVFNATSLAESLAEKTKTPRVYWSRPERKSVSENYRKAVERCLSEDPTERPALADLANGMFLVPNTNVFRRIMNFIFG